MGKKDKQNSKASTPHKEAFMRMNFLFQAAHVHMLAQPSSPQLSRYYIHTMKSVARKLVLRIFADCGQFSLVTCRDPTIKRTTCKYCFIPLVHGLTATVRHRSRREKHIVVTCLLCGTVKRFNTRRKDQFLSDPGSPITQTDT